MAQGQKQHRNSGTNQAARDIVCPFFRSHSYVEINCEGYTDDMTCTMKYKRGDDKRQQQRIYCQENYRYCEHYNALMLIKYKE